MALRQAVFEDALIGAGAYAEVTAVPYALSQGICV